MDFNVIPLKNGLENVAGFYFGGAACGLKKTGENDLAFIRTDEPVDVEAIFTSNRFAAAPIVHFRRTAARCAGENVGENVGENGGENAGENLGADAENIAETNAPNSNLTHGGLQTNFILMNSKNANAMTGEAGVGDIDAIFAALGSLPNFAAAGVRLHNPLMSSTGVIGYRLDVARLVAGAGRLALGGRDSDGAVRGIMTTDSFKKELAFRVELLDDDGENSNLSGADGAAGANSNSSGADGANSSGENVADYSAGRGIATPPTAARNYGKNGANSNLTNADGADFTNKNGETNSSNSNLTGADGADDETSATKSSPRAFNIAAICKGAGMINPAFATMLCFIITDADIPRADMRELLAAAVRQSFNAVSVDGDTSTNDTAMLLASRTAAYDKDAFAFALGALTKQLALMLVADGEGSSKVVAFEVAGAASAAQAERAAKALSNSLLVKTAIFGEDPNWGRIASTIGASGVECSEARLRIFYDDVLVFDREHPQLDAAREAAAHRVMTKPSYKIRCELGVGAGEFVAYGCDLGHRYVEINSDYRS